MSDLNCTVSIGRLLPEDAIATINNNSPLSAVEVPIGGSGSYDFGTYFDLMNAVIKHSILNLTVESIITIQINSNINNAITISNSFDSALNNIDNPDPNAGFIQQINAFINTLPGRTITVNMSHNNPFSEENTQKIVYQGYIVSPPAETNVKVGTELVLVCKTTLAQLDVMSSNGSYQDATQKYGNIFSTLTANQINTDTLFETIIQDTLAEDIGIQIVDGGSSALPDRLWAMILPDDTRLAVLREILVPYSRIIFQYETGDIFVQPLFIDDYADDVYNVDNYTNSESNWLNITGSNRASSIPNRMDIIYGSALPVPGYGMPGIDSNIFCSSPRISADNTIEPTNVGGLNYTDVYKSSARLYNSGKFIMPQQRTIAIDNSLTTNQNLLNSITGLYNSNDLFNSVIYNSSNNSINTIPQLYSQIYMAMINVDNYNATIVYDYLVVVDADSPLSKIINIANFNPIDYPEMICTDTALSFGANQPTLYVVDLCPILSITGVWFNVGDAYGG